MNRNNSNQGGWLSRHKNEAFWCMFFGVVGYLIGSYCQEHFEIDPKVEALTSKVNKVDSILTAHTIDARLAIDHIVYNVNDGVDCNVGINDGVSDNFVSMSEYMADQLGVNKTIYIINRRIDGSCIHIVPVIVSKGVTEDPKDTKFYVSENTLRRLGVEDKYPRRRGIYKMSYKRVKEQK